MKNCKISGSICAMSNNDVNGNRVRNTISGSSDNYYFNGADGKTEAVALLPLSNVTYNILGAGGDNIGQLRVINSNPARYYYLKDHLGSIKMTVDATGTVQGYDDYYPYGMQMTGRSMTSSEDGRYKFTGKERDASDGLDYFGKRYYDSWKAGWDQVDPWDYKYPSHSPYNYCTNNPIRFVDTTGKGGGSGDPTDAISQWFYNNYNSEVNTLSNMAYNAASNFVHWGEGASEFGEDLGDKVALIGSGLTVSTLLIPGAEEFSPETAAMTVAGLGLSQGSQYAKTGFLAIDAFVFNGSKDKFIVEAINSLKSTAFDRLMNSSINKMTIDLPPALQKGYESLINEVQNCFGL